MVINFGQIQTSEYQKGRIFISFFMVLISFFKAYL